MCKRTQGQLHWNLPDGNMYVICHIHPQRRFNKGAVLPASIYITKDQIKILADFDEDVVVNEQHLIASALDFWVLDENSKNGEHRSVVIEQGGTVISDAVVSDSI